MWFTPHGFLLNPQKLLEFRQIFCFLLFLVVSLSSTRVQSYKVFPILPKVKLKTLFSPLIPLSLCSFLSPPSALSYELLTIQKFVYILFREKARVLKKFRSVPVGAKNGVFGHLPDFQRFMISVIIRFS